MLTRRSVVPCFSLVFLISGFTFAAEPSWGNLKMRFQYDGKAPDLRALTINKDEAVCGKEKSFDESLLVNEKNGGLASVIVWLEVKEDQKLPKEHADHVAAAKKEVELEVVKCKFQPRVSLLRTNQTLLVTNRDPMAHNEYILSLANRRYAATIQASGVNRHAFEKADQAPASILCNIHPWMAGWALIQAHPYMAFSNADGNLEVRNVPVGKWTFIARCHLAKPTGERLTEWKKGRFDVEIRPEGTDLGTIKLSSEVFKK